jgi:hypothetical protein
MPAPTDDGRAHEGRDTSRQVDDVTTRVVDRTLLSEEAPTPEQRRVHAVDESDPQRHDEEPRLELETPHQPAEEEQRRDGGEDELEVGEGRRREVERDRGVGPRDRLTLLGAGG